MDKSEKELIDEVLGKETYRRRKLIPIWIKVFVWIFLFFGGLVPVGLILGAFGASFSISLYGLSTNEPVTILGLFISILFLIKAIVAMGLWTEKDWAVNAAMVDAILGILICVVVMFVLPFTTSETKSSFTVNFNFRLELLLLIPYLVVMNRIRKDWKAASN